MLELLNGVHFRDRHHFLVKCFSQVFQSVALERFLDQGDVWGEVGGQRLRDHDERVDYGAEEGCFPLRARQG